MSTYTKTTNFTAKDNLTSGDPAKVIKGSEFDTEFNSIETAVNSKANANNTVLTGTTTVDTADINTLQIDGSTVTATPAELNTLDGITSTTAELNTLDGFTGTVDDLNYAKDLRASGVTSAEFDKIDGLTADSTELNILDGATVTTAELNILDGVTATALEINTLDGITASTAELNVTDGLTATTAELNTLDGITSSTAELNILDGVTASTTEINYVDGVTSGIQGQLDGKADSVHTHVKADITDFSDADYATAAQGALADSALQPSDPLDAVDSITITSTDADGDLDPALNIYRNSSTPVNNDLLGVVKFTGRNDNAEDFEYGTIYTSVVDVADGSEDGKMHFGVGVAGVPQSVKMTVDSTGIDVSGLSISGTAVTSTAAELNVLDGITSTTAELNILDGVTADATEINVLDGITATTTELNYTDGVTSNIQTQLDGKATTAQGALADSAVQPNDNVSFGTGSFSGAVDVTGTVTADGLTVDGSVDVNLSSQVLDISFNDVGYLKLNHDSRGGDYRVATSGSTAENLRIRNGASQTLITLANNGDVSFYEDTGTTAKMVWDASAEQLDIDGKVTSTDLVVTKGASAENIFQVFGGGTIYHGVGIDGEGTIITAGSTGSADSEIKFKVSSTGTESEAMRIDSSGNVGIGTASPSSALSVATNGGAWTTSSSDGVGINYNSGNANISTYLDNSTLQIGAGVTQKNGMKIYGQTGGNRIEFQVAGSERARIDSSGNLLVGKTSTGIQVAGLETWSNGLTQITRSGNKPLALNRLSDDGSIVEFNKDSSLVGSIGAYTGGDRLYLGTGDTGVVFADSIDTIFPMNPSTNSIRDGAVSLGTSTGRFKDLYLSGGVYLGGTGSANKLDDYEEGVWTPAFGGWSGTTYSAPEGRYTKVGRLVTLHFRLTVSNIGTFVSNSRITGLPFPGNGFSETAAVGAQPTLMTMCTDARDDHYMAIYNGGSDIFIYTSTGTARNGNSFQAGTIAGTISYLTNS